MPGFRPGKAPLALLEKRYAKTVEEDVIRSLVPDFYDKAVRQAGIVRSSSRFPRWTGSRLKRDAPFTFTATVEIKPKIELRDYKAPNPISLKPDKRTVTDEQLDRGHGGLARTTCAAGSTHQPATAVVDGDYRHAGRWKGSSMEQPLEGTRKTGHLHKVGSNATVLGLGNRPHVGEKKRAMRSKFLSRILPAIRILGSRARPSRSR